MKNIFEALGPAFRGNVAMEETASDHFQEIPTKVDPEDTATLIDKLEDDHEGVNQERRVDEPLPEENVSDEVKRDIEAIEAEGKLDENLSGEGTDLMDIPDNPKAEKMGGIAPAADDAEKAPEIIEQIKENTEPNNVTIDDTGFAENKDVEHMLAEQNGQSYDEHSDDQSIFADAKNETEVTSADKMHVQVPGDNGNDEFKTLEEAREDQGSTETNDTPEEKNEVGLSEVEGEDNTILDSDSNVEEDSTEDNDEGSYSEELEEDEEEVAKEDLDTETEDEEINNEEKEDEAEVEEENEEKVEEEEEVSEEPEEPTDETSEDTSEISTSDETEDNSEVAEELALLDSVEIKGVLGGDSEDLQEAKDNVKNETEDSSTSLDEVSTMKSVNTADGNQEFSSEEMPDGVENPVEGTDSLASKVTELASQDEDFDKDKVTINRYDEVGETSTGSDEEPIGDDVSSDDMGSPADDASDEGTEPETPEEPEEKEDEAPATESVNLTWEQKMKIAIAHAVNKR